MAISAQIPISVHLLILQQSTAVKGGSTNNLFLSLKTYHPKKYRSLKAERAVTEASTLGKRKQSDQPTILDALSCA